MYFILRMTPLSRTRRGENRRAISPVDVFLSNAWRAERVGICMYILHGLEQWGMGRNFGRKRGSMRWHVLHMILQY